MEATVAEVAGATTRRVSVIVPDERRYDALD
jgi:hypothetical protein